GAAGCASPSPSLRRRGASARLRSPESRGPGRRRRPTSMSGVSSPEPPDIEVGRRRRPGPRDSGERRRAEAPRRRREGDGDAQPAAPPPATGSGYGGPGYPTGTPDQGTGGPGWGAAPPPSGQQPGGGIFGGGGGGGTGVGGGGGGGFGMPMIGLIVLLVLCAGAFFLFGGNLFGGSDQPGPDVPPPAAQASATPRPAAQATPTRRQAAATPGATGQGDRWTVMLYQDADDQILEQDIYVDLNEAERVGSSDNVQIVAQIDRYQAGYTGDGNWVSAKRFRVTRDDDLSRVGSEQVADLGEVDMADPRTLVDFATWAMQTYPADKYALILSDHGMGWPGGWTDPTASNRPRADVPIAEALPNQMFLMEIDDALGQIRANTGVDKIELVGMDACLMSGVEVLQSLAPHARYAVASEEVEPALGWAYTSFLSALQENPRMNGADLGRAIVETYIEDDQRIRDDQARAEYAGGGPAGFGSLFGGGPSADQLSQQLSQDVTLTAVDLNAMPQLIDGLNNMAFQLQSVNQRSVAQARTYAQSFTSVFGPTVPPAYIDLGHFASLLQSANPGGELAAALDSVQQGIDAVVVAEKHGPNKPGATGISFYFPNSLLYRSPVAGPASYTQVARRFAESSVWDDFLAFHYTGRQFERAAVAAVVPERGQQVTPPAAGVQVSQVRLSGQEVAPGDTIRISADVRGENVGYVKLFLGYFDQAANSINVVDIDYLESPDTREVNGVFYPDWGDTGQFTVQFDWEPIVFAINDGVNTVEALLTPEEYGAAPEQAIYSVEGIYTYANGEKRYARMYFRDGYLHAVVGFTGESGTGSPREITPTRGDSFTVLQRWMDLDQSGNVAQNVQQEGETIQFGDDPITWEELDAAAGDYIVGFIVEDLDGQEYPAYGAVRVR
ncbi:MAG TPA: clostripain-related cysteine peptidase, partial [Chloroflexia bacterium]|nr:clostripain-related cysteine peptidase [Chloroflexia bacterium]